MHIFFCSERNTPIFGPKLPRLEATLRRVVAMLQLKVARREKTTPGDQQQWEKTTN